MKLSRDPTDNKLIEQELEISKQYGKLKGARDQFLKQKEKIQWIQEGDQNTKFYHNYIKTRRNTNIIFGGKDKHGERQEGMEEISKAFLEYYSELLGQSNKGRKHVCREIIMKGSLVNKEQREQLAAKFTEKEVKEAMWSIDGNKSPGPYEYGSPFFKDNWEIIGKDVVKGVMEFFRTKKMLTGMNDTTITLITEDSAASDNIEQSKCFCGG
ncbi:uncharacterized protein [Solanum lycopersicum]|uniref:uncharacterized protein n=1 Tax=Solanum lycopersicum TaxID=4081 RepID=UPI003747C29F